MVRAPRMDSLHSGTIEKIEQSISLRPKPGLRARLMGNFRGTSMQFGTNQREREKREWIIFVGPAKCYIVQLSLTLYRLMGRTSAGKSTV